MIIKENILKALSSQRECQFSYPCWHLSVFYAVKTDEKYSIEFFVLELLHPHIGTKHSTLEESLWFFSLISTQSHFELCIVKQSA